MKLFLAISILLICTSCKEENINPNQQILGKWEEFYIGNGEARPPIQEPTASWHFLPDSVLLEFDYATEKTYTRKYWIDSLLNIGTEYTDGTSVKFYYTPKFYADTMELRSENTSSIFSVSKWKRIN